MPIGERIKQVRESEGLSQRDFAARLGTASGRISQIEQDKNVPGGEFLLRMHQEFGVDVTWLLTGSGGGTVPAAPLLTVDERELLALFRAAPLAVKAAAIGALQGGAQATAPRTKQVTVTASGRDAQAAGRKIINKGGKS